MWVGGCGYMGIQEGVYALCVFVQQAKTLSCMIMTMLVLLIVYIPVSHEMSNQAILSDRHCFFHLIRQILWRSLGTLP